MFLESLNLAALWHVPVLFVCENNGYATSLKIAEGMAGTALGRAAAFGIPGVTVDGMDAEAVHAAAAVTACRDGKGPAFIECMTYRFDAHHTWEHKARVRYRSDEEVAAGRSRDPMDVQGDRLDPAERERVDAEIEAVLDGAVALARSSAHPDIGGAMRYLYATGLRTRTGVGEMVV